MGLMAYELMLRSGESTSDWDFDSVSSVSYCPASTLAMADYRSVPVCPSSSTPARATDTPDPDLLEVRSSSFRVSMRNLESDTGMVKRLGSSVARGLEQQANPLLGVLPQRQFRISVSCRACTARCTILHAKSARSPFDKLRMTLVATTTLRLLRIR